MKLINSKLYDVKHVLNEGECMLCGKRLTFLFGDVNITATCCDFVYSLERTTDKQECKVLVGACTGD